MLAVLAVAIVGIGAWRDSRGAAEHSYPLEPVRISGEGWLTQQGDGPIQLCVGLSGAIPGPEPCGRTVPITEVSWQQVPGVHRYGSITQATVTITGIWGGGVLAVESVTAPQMVPGLPIPDLPPLCDNPTGTPNTDPYAQPDIAALQELPGYQLTWVTYPKHGPNAGGVLHNVSFTRDHEPGAEVARRDYGGLVCVGTLPGPSLKVLMAATEKLTSDADRVNVPGLILYGVAAGSVIDGRVGLQVDTFVATAEMVARITELVGPEIAPWVTVVGAFRIVG